MKKLIPDVLVLLVLMSPLSLTACPDEGKRPLGGTCSGDDQCTSGLCLSNVCLDPNGDEDQDGVINQVEGALGTDPFSRDTDADGVEDGEEIGDISNPLDGDGDGKPDAIESRTGDADSDCLADQLDPDDTSPETDPAVLGAELCVKVGACGAEGAVVTATCPSDRVPVCDYSQVPEYEADEQTCDSVDNDCDGETDERHKAGGSVTFDGGGFAGDAGKVLGDACGTGACAGGLVVCALDRSSLVCSTTGTGGALTCGADNNCNGADDLTEVADPLTTPLLGCVDYYIDADEDTFGVDDEVKCLCAPAGDYTVLVGGDCADGDDTVFPNAPAICGGDSDCVDGLLDGGEACDDGNEVASDGCDGCKVAGLVLENTISGDGRPHIANLAGGGFAVAWDNGYAGESWLGNALVIFGTAGVEVGRYDGLGDDMGNGSSFALEASGDVVLYLEWAFTGQGYQLTGRRFGPDGLEIGQPIPLSPTMEPAWSFGATATATGAFVVWWATSNELSLVSLSAAGVVGEVGGFTDLDAWDLYEFDVLGFADGTTMVTWIRASVEGDLWTQERRRQRFDAGGVALGEPVLEDDARSLWLARWSGGWAVMKMLEVIEGQVDGVTVMAQRFTDDTRVGPALEIIGLDTDGCPYEAVGGFDADDNAYALLSDGECRSPVRGKVLLGGVATNLPLGVELLPESVYSSDLGASRSGPITAAYMARDERTGVGQLLLYRFGPGIEPVWVRLVQLDR